MNVILDTVYHQGFTTQFVASSRDSGMEGLEGSRITPPRPAWTAFLIYLKET